ncbi:MAG: tetratricopeptide repeat protein [Bacteroidota bacterium]
MNKNRIKLLEKYIEDDPEDPFNKYALAMEYHDEAPETATEILSTLQKSHKDYLPLYFKLAHLYWEEEQYEEAEFIFETGIELAEQQNDEKALKELKAAYLNFDFDKP